MAEVVSPQSPLGPSDTNEGKGHRAAQETYTCERMSVILWRCWANEGRMYYSSIYENCQLTSPYHIIRISYLINMFIMFSWCPMNTIMRSTYVLQGSSLYNMNGWMMKPSPGWSGNHEPPLSKLHRWLHSINYPEFFTMPGQCLRVLNKCIHLPTKQLNVGHYSKGTSSEFWTKPSLQLATCLNKYFLTNCYLRFGMIYRISSWTKCPAESPQLHSHWSWEKSGQLRPGAVPRCLAST